MKNFHTYLLLLLLSMGCKPSSIEFATIKHSNKNIAYEGRIGKTSDGSASEIYWSGSSIKINFKGTDANITLEDENGANYFNVILDGTPIKVIKLEKGKKTYNLLKDLPNKKHSIELTKRNEWTYGKTLFYNLEIKGELLHKDPQKPFFIEFYGDSITTGHGNEDYSGNDKPEGNVSNNYTTYAAMTARHFNSEYSCIARGGIGIMVSWHTMIMPEMYFRLNPSDANSKWDFSTKQPDIIVINLLQNDSWIVNHPNHKEYKKRFGTKKPNDSTIIKAYSNFVNTIRTKYKTAPIICLLGNMDITKENSVWPNYVRTAIDRLEDTNTYACFVPYKNTPGHPKVEEHELIAKQLTTLITEKKLIH